MTKKKQKKEEYKIRESFRTITPRNKIVSREFDVMLGDKNVGYLNYGKEATDGGTEGFTRNFEKRLKKDDAAINLVLVERGYVNYHRLKPVACRKVKPQVD